MTNIRTVVDTNLWISYLIGGKYSKLEILIDHPDIVLLFSSELINEFISVATRPKFAKSFDEEDLDDLLELLYDIGEFVSVRSSISVCRDQKDNFLLALAIDGQADCLLTGDNDLLAVGTINGTSILTVSDFLVRFTN